MIQPSIAAWKLPNGQSRFTYYVRSPVGHATSVIKTYTGSAGDVRVRTNAIVYAANNLDVLSVTNAANLRVEYNVYNANHEVTASYDALGQLTSYTYDAYGRLTSVARPSGLVTTNLYGTDGYLAETRDIGVRTNYYTWANGLVHTHTDELGLTVTLNLGRPQPPGQNGLPGWHLHHQRLPEPRPGAGHRPHGLQHPVRLQQPAAENRQH